MIWPFKKRRRLVCRKIAGMDEMYVMYDASTDEPIYYGGGTVWRHYKTGRRVGTLGEYDLARIYSLSIERPNLEAEKEVADAA